MTNDRFQKEFKVKILNKVNRNSSHVENMINFRINSPQIWRKLVKCEIVHIW